MIRDVALESGLRAHLADVPPMDAHVLPEVFAALPSTGRVRPFDRRRRLAFPMPMGAPRIATALVGTIVVAATLVLAFAATGPGAVPSVSPAIDQPRVVQVNTFVVPFSYALPATGDLHPAADTFDGYGLVEGEHEPTEPIPSSDPPVAYGMYQLTAERGIAVLAVDGAYTHPCPMASGERSRVPVGGGTPASFRDGLDVLGGMPSETVTEATLDGRPAVRARLSTRTRCETADIHIEDDMAAFEARRDLWVDGAPNYLIRSLDWVSFAGGPELTIADIDGHTIAVLVWAGTPSDLDAWLPVAHGVIDSIRFLPEPSTTP